MKKVFKLTRKRRIWNSSLKKKKSAANICSVEYASTLMLVYFLLGLSSSKCWDYGTLGRNSIPCNGNQVEIVLGIKVVLFQNFISLINLLTKLMTFFLKSSQHNSNFPRLTVLKSEIYFNASKRRSSSWKWVPLLQ